MRQTNCYQAVWLPNTCACLNKSFAQLKELGSLETAKAAGVGVECCGCLPYLKIVFKTGETEFAIEDPRIEDASFGRG